MKLPDSNKLVLFIKVSKEFTLAAVTRHFIKFYFFKLKLEEIWFLAIITASFDDPDEPLCIRTLILDDEPSSNLLKLLLEPEFDIYFFDENSREVASFKAKLADPFGLREYVPNFIPSVRDDKFVGEAYKLAVKRFSYRNGEDDAHAIYAALDEEIFPFDVFTIDLDEKLSGYAGSHPVAHHSLVQENPGNFQEASTVQMLQRLFENEQLFMNPMRADQLGKEFSDALIVTSTHVVIIQAKDSPNTSGMINRSLARKRSTSQKQISTGFSQLKGAIRHSRRDDYLKIRIGTDFYDLPVAGKTFIGIVIVNELFPDELDLHHKNVFEGRIQNVCDVVLLDYGGFASLIFHATSQDHFVNFLHKLSSEVITGQYPEITQFILRSRQVRG